MFDKLNFENDDVGRLIKWVLGIIEDLIELDKDLDELILLKIEVNGSFDVLDVDIDDDIISFSVKFVNEC